MVVYMSGLNLKTFTGCLQKALHRKEGENKSHWVLA